jgi:hypothetical protein
LGGNGNFLGTIYAPNAALNLNGSGSARFDFCGASVTDSVQMNGNFQLHYDEALGRIGPFRRYIVTRWDEMGPVQMRASLIDTSPRNLLR